MLEDEEEDVALTSLCNKRDAQQAQEVNEDEVNEVLDPDVQLAVDAIDPTHAEPEKVKLMRDMGISESCARDALLRFANDLERAVDFALMAPAARAGVASGPSSASNLIIDVDSDGEQGAAADTGEGVGGAIAVDSVDIEAQAAIEADAKAASAKDGVVEEAEAVADGGDRKRPRTEVVVPKKPPCVICLDLDATHAVVPCGHQCLCAECQKMELRACPVCQGSITQLIRIFL